MTVDTGRSAPRAIVVAAAFACLGLGVLSGCSKTVAPLHQLDTQSVETPKCDDLQKACPSVDVSCSSNTAATCVTNAAKSFAGYCSVAKGALPCLAGNLTNDYKAYCKVQACFGTAEADCIAEGQKSCQSCDLIDPIVKSCPGWSTSSERDSCSDFTPTQESCVAGVLNDLASSGDQCVNWYEPRVICLGKHIGLEGYASCAIQDCLGLTTLEACAQNYDILCSWTI